METVDWAAVRRAYEQSNETLKQICDRFGVTKGQLEHRQKKERWPSRRSTHRERQDSTLERLLSVLEKQVTKLANASGETLGDKEAQQLTELTKNFEKLAHLASDEAKAELPPQRRDIKDIRAKLAKRIEQFKRR